MPFFVSDFFLSFNNKLAYRYKLAPTDACPVCGLPASRTHNAGNADLTTTKFINRHNVAWQLTHATNNTAFTGGGTIYSLYELRLITMDA